MSTLKFKVDAALLRELGERLVGKPHYALAELIKNAYDADATKVEIAIADDEIVVSDNGHGMSMDDFKDFWMRIGTTHKMSKAKTARGRQLTGQKGVGRLAVQFLGNGLKLNTLSKSQSKEIQADIDWGAAINKVGASGVKDLTDVEVNCVQLAPTSEFAGGSSHGTKIVISQLSEKWNEEAVKSLAQELWMLQPPFEEVDEAKAFHVSLAATDHLRKVFDGFMQAFRTLWHARVSGKLTPPRIPGGPGSCTINLMFRGGDPQSLSLAIEKCPLRELSFDVFVYSLTGRQAWGVKVNELRDYLRQFGNVGIYDAGFRLPFYGINTDWLGLQLDHSRRLSLSKLLPEELQVERGLNDLPTAQRIFGAARVNTSGEATWVRRYPDYPKKPLSIAITRDRLTEGAAFDTLRDIVRTALDFYAVREHTRDTAKALASAPIDRASTAIQRVTDVLEKHGSPLPPAVLREVKHALNLAGTSLKLEEQVSAKRASMLGALATTGIAAVAFEHEAGRQLRRLDAIAKRLMALARTQNPESELVAILAGELEQWLVDFRNSRQLFSSMTDPSSHEEKHRHRAKAFLRELVSRLGVLRRGAEIDVEGVDEGLLLPLATFTEWSAIFQNVLVNAVNATLDADERRISITSRRQGVSQLILVQDTGVGVDVEKSQELFEPFVRKLELSAARRGLGIGGSGLGLSIVRMIASSIGCHVSFVPPDKGYATAFRVSWSEKK